MRERLLLKLSGGDLGSSTEMYSEEKIKSLVSQIKELSLKSELGIVIGGGNLWRGRENKLSFLKNFERDYVGMVATVINCFVLKQALEEAGLKARLFSALKIERISEEYSLLNIEEALNSKEIVLFGGGIGEPCFSTDSAAIMRAVEIGAKIVLMGKEGVSGVYDKDPKIFQDAIFFSEISYDELISREIKALDRAALILAKENKLKLLIFNQGVENSFVRALNGEIQHSEIS